MFSPPTADTSATSFYTGDFAAAMDTKNPKAVAGQFEALFYRMMFEQMRASIDEDPLMGGYEGEQVQSMFHDELSSILGARGSLGIGDMVTQHMEQRQGLLKS